MELDSLFFGGLDFFFCEAKRRGIGQTGEGTAEKFKLKLEVHLGAL